MKHPTHENPSHLSPHGLPGHGVIHTFGVAPGAGVAGGAGLGGGASATAVAALVLAILSWVGGGCLCSLPGFFLARSELANIQQGVAPLAGKGLAQAAYWVSFVNLVLYALLVVGAAVIFALMSGTVAGQAS